MSDSGKTQRRRLGKDGPEVLPIGLGLMSLSGTYGPSDDKAAEALIRRAVELGVASGDGQGLLVELDRDDVETRFGHGFGDDRASPAQADSCADERIRRTPCK